VAFPIPKRIWHILTVLLAAVILLWAVLGGLSAGKTQAQTQLVIQNAREITKGFSYFYSDNNRYPAISEYQNQNLMLEYFNYFPPRNLAFSLCGENYIYKRNSNSSFQLNFCLPKASQGFKAGWNQITEDK
jgi:hypothetical protein